MNRMSSLVTIYLPKLIHIFSMGVLLKVVPSTIRSFYVTNSMFSPHNLLKYVFREKELLEQEENVKTLSKALANADNHRAILQSKIRQLQTSSANRKSYSTFSRASSASSRPGTQGSTRNRLVKHIREVNKGRFKVNDSQ